MEMVLDFLLGFAALAAGAYCLVLSRRLRALSRIDGSLGGAVAVLSSQVDDLTQVLAEARAASASAQADLGARTARAEAAARRLELLLASMHDLERARLKTDVALSAPARAEQAGGRQDPPAAPPAVAVAAKGADPETAAPGPRVAFWRTQPEAPVAVSAASEDVVPAPRAARPRILRRARRAGAGA